MDPLLFLTYTLLSTYFQSGTVVIAQQSFTISSVTLSIKPHTDVPRNTNVTIRCEAKVLTSGSDRLTRNYSLYKDNEMVESKTTTTMEDYSYQLLNVKVSSNGKYRCQLSIEDQEMTSETEKLTVKGVSNPVLYLTKPSVVEGEELTVNCSVPNETGSILVSFYDNNKEIHEMQMDSDPAQAKIRLKDVGNHDIHCSYAVVLTRDSVKSERSNVISVTVKELSISPVLEIFPVDNIYEGDPLNITCTTRNFLRSSESVSLYLSEGTKMLGLGNTSINYNMPAPASISSLTFECMLIVKNVKKVDTEIVPVSELFSKPTLTMSPPQVFQKDPLTLICRTERIAPERLKSSDLIYSLYPLQNVLPQRHSGVFSIKASFHDFNYTCMAQAKNIKKFSQILTVRPKVLVSSPEISVIGNVILGHFFKIYCRSFNGSKPITYTLFKEDDQIGKKIIYDHDEDASFDIRISHTDDISKYFCEATNKDRLSFRSRALNVSVIVPTSNITLSTVPGQQSLVEGSNLHLLCTVKGTPPITFRWRRVDNPKPVHTIISSKNHEFYEVPVLSKQHSGEYLCEAFNLANINVKSPFISIEVRMAMWKKGLIGGIVMLVVMILILMGCLIYFKSKRGQRETAAELSVKPSSPKSDDSLKVHLTHDTEVYNAATVKVKGTTVSVWSEGKPEAENDEANSSLSKETDVEYTEVVHPRSANPVRAVPLKKGTDTVYSELQNSPHGAADHHDYGSIEYADLNSEEPECNQYHPDAPNCRDLPVPVD